MCRLAVSLMFLIGACGFDHGQLGAGGDGGIDAPDAMPDALTSCTPNEKVCAGRKLETCNSTGTGVDAAQSVVCPLSCEAQQCTQARNLPVDVQTACTKATGAALVLPAASSTLLAAEADAYLDDTISCLPGTTCTFPTIAPAGTIDQPGNRDIVYYCLSELTMEVGSSVFLNDDSLFSPVFFVDGNVIIEGLIDNDGDYAGQAGAGGYRGGLLSGGAGNPGLGGCGGGGGTTAGTGSNVAGGGGGGGGAHTGGARGGAGRDSTTANGGAAGAATCDPPMLLEPLVGGSGGGGGGAGTCGNVCGQQGGGGGGALQIIATGHIEIRTGAAILCNGGGGGFNVTGDLSGGGAGGGAGGVILLEAPDLLVVDGTLNVDGGYGGSSGAGAGGIPGTTTTAPTVGTSYTATPAGGAGGGGAIGRIRLESESSTACAPVTTTANPCTAGPLKRVP